MKYFKYLYRILVVALLTGAMISCDSEENAIPRLSLDARYVISQEGNTITFTNVSSGAVTYLWDFGNGETTDVISPVETFENGTYIVTLTAFDAEGNSDTFSDTLIIDVLVCEDETMENIDPANGDIMWTFLTQNDDTTFDAFGDTAGFLVDNPVLDDVNISCTVQRFEKTPGCQTFAGLGVALATPINFATTSNKIFKMKVLAETQLTEVTLRLEFMPFPNTEPSQDRVASITELGEWQELTFDFSDVPAGTFQSMIIYFERNAPCDGDIYYFDDIIQQ